METRKHNPQISPGSDGNLEEDLGVCEAALPGELLARNPTGKRRKVGTNDVRAGADEALGQRGQECGRREVTAGPAGLCRGAGVTAK